MRLLTSLLMLGLAVAVATPTEAKERRRKSSDYERAYEERSTTVDRRGLCQRDTGRPVERLNLNHRCDQQ